MVTSVDGHSLFEPLLGNEEYDFDLDASVPVQRLLAISSDLEEGQEVEVEYVQGGESQTATVEARELSTWDDDSWDNDSRSGSWDFARPTLDRFRNQLRGEHGVPGVPRAPRAPGAPGVAAVPRVPGVPELEGRFELRSDVRELREHALEIAERAQHEARLGTRYRGSRRAPDVRVFMGPDASETIIGDNLLGNVFTTMGMGGMHGIDLLEMKPGLASYFGAEDGVLVTSVDEESTLGLEPGDVILSIGDREATSSSRVRRILSTYDEDEDITLRIMRDHDEMTVTGLLGGYPGRASARPWRML